MSTYNPTHSYDIIFAGGGTAACVAAGRLAAADPSLSILIVERGKNNLNDATVTTPLLYITALAPGSTTMINYQAESEAALNHRARVLSSGGILGGGGSVNAMMYTRASKVDYDGFGVEGWDGKTLIEYAKKLENAQLGKNLDEAVHGFSGPVEITMGTHAPQGPMDDLFAAAESMGIPQYDDLQDFTACHGIAPSAKYIGCNGTRQDPAHRYIHPLMADGKHPNLHILPESKVIRVLFKDNRAVGIEYIPEPSFLPAGSDEAATTPKTIKAKNLVVVSAGPLGSPLILERSGIGKKELLEEVGIEVVSDLPGVGENLQDHHFLLPAYKTHLRTDETMEGLITGQFNLPQMLVEKSPILGWNGIDVIGKLRMSDAEAAALGSKFKAVWDRDFAPHPSKPVTLVGSIAMFMGDREKLAESMKEGRDGKEIQYVTMASFTPYPYSRGSIHITSPDATVAPKLITGFLSDEHGIDLKKLVWAYKKTRDLYRRTNAFAGEVAVQHPKFPKGSAAAVSEGPLAQKSFGSVEERRKITPVVYSGEDDRAIEEFVRDNVGSTWHTLGTCRIGEREEGGVVDKDMNVYGTVGLKCCDLSVIPKNVGANTYNTALIVGEKAADVIARELRIAV